jgi:hypothetical protein
VSLAASAITETIASIVKWRSKTLKKGVSDLPNDQSFGGLALAVYNHALVNPRADGTATAQNPPPNSKLPAYIDRQHFAHALMDVVGISSAALSPAALKQQVANRVQNVQLRGLLEGIVDRTASTAVDVQPLIQGIPNVVPAAQHGELPGILTAIVDRTTQPQPGDPASLRARITNLHDADLRQILSDIVDRTSNVVGVLTDPNAIKARVDAVVPNGQLRTLLYGIVDRTVGDTQKVSGEIALWFDSAMDRMSGAYKRWSQLISFIAGLFLVIMLNISAVHITERLWVQPVDTKRLSQISGMNSTEASQLIDKLSVLSPDIGWKDWNTFSNFWSADLWAFNNDAWVRVLGWVITALATLFGAAFWFDALQQIVRLKGAGPSPLEKIQGKSAAS